MTYYSSSRNRSKGSTRRRSIHSGKSLPEFMDGTKRTTPIKHSDATYPTIPVDNEKK